NECHEQQAATPIDEGVVAHGSRLGTIDEDRGTRGGPRGPIRAPRRPESRSLLDHGSPERPQREDAHLERLDTERDPDHRETQENPAREVTDEDLPPEEQEPQHVEDDGQKAPRPRRIDDLAPERPERKRSE